MSFVGRFALAATLVGSALFGLAYAVQPQDGAKPAPKAEGQKETKKAEILVPFFGNEKCPVTGKAVKHDLSVAVEGQNVYVCSKNCVAKVKADGKAMVAIAYKDVKPAGNKTCPVSGHEIAAGKSKEMTWQGHSVTLCCADCEKAFTKEPTIALAKAIYGAEDLKNAKCPVMDDDAATADDIVIYKGKIIRMCCPDCASDAKFVADPDKYLAKASGK